MSTVSAQKAVSSKQGTKVNKEAQVKVVQKEAKASRYRDITRDAAFWQMAELS